MKYVLSAAACLLLAVPAQGEEFGQLHDAIRYCQPKTQDPQLIISSCLKAIDSNLIDRDALAEAWINVAAAHLMLKQFDDAGAAASHAIDADPNKWQAYVDRAIVEFTQKKAQDAENDLDKAISLAPREIGPVQTRGRLYLAEGRFDLAVADLSAAIALDSDAAQAYGLRAIAYDKQGKHDLAAADRAELQKRDPDDKFGLLHPKTN